MDTHCPHVERIALKWPNLAMDVPVLFDEVMSVTICEFDSLCFSGQ
jgi:hypothetical protein